MAHRIKLYLFGFIGGIILVFLFYGNRGNSIWDWMPEKRVLKRLRMTEHIINDSLTCILNCYEVSSEDWESILSEGKVMFDEARKKPYPIYTVTHSMKQQDLAFRFETVDTLSVLKTIEITPQRNCNCP